MRKGSDLLVAALLVPTLEAAFAEGGMNLVAVPIDDAENTRVLVEEPSGRLPEVEPA